MMSTRAGISAHGRSELTLLTGRGRRLLAVEDVATALGVDNATAAKRLAHWAAQGWMRRVRRGLYLAVPLEAENPRTWSEDPLVLADAVWAPCYFTGWTAANHWGLTEQLFRTTVLKTTGRVRHARESLLEHEYLLTHVAERNMTWGLTTVWRDGRKLTIADPARTIIDSLDDPRLVGGIRLGSEILVAYLSDGDVAKLVEYGDRLGNRAVFKRLGYLVEASRLDNASLRDECMNRISAGISLLDPSAPARGERISEWGLRANVRIESPEAS
jgi:predicted transcriptional regulator of viral defense system